MENTQLTTQLDELLDVMKSLENKSDQIVSSQAISPLERLLRTKPIWFLLDVTREESFKLLHDKKQGNFIIRGSRQPNTLAISIKLGSNHGGIVKHFIILQKEKKVCLEDSDLQFANFVSLAFHYSHVCDELPEKLSLPDLLETSSTVKNLLSLALLGKSFWSYPLAKSDRESLFVMDKEAFNLNCQLSGGTQSSVLTAGMDRQHKHFSDSHIFGQNRNLSSLQKPAKYACLENTNVTKTPPRAPRKSSLGTSSPSPPSKSKFRRNSDSVPFVMSPTRAPRVSRNSLASLYSVSPSGHTPKSRSRKLSVFDGLGCVQEIHENDDADKEAVYEDILEQCIDSGNINSDDLHEKEEDYAYPVDSVNNDTKHNIYEDPSCPIARIQSDFQKEAQDMFISMRCQNNMSSEKDDTNDSDSQHDDIIRRLPRDTRKCDKRKLSLGVILRKISTGSVQGRKTSLQDLRLSSAFSSLKSLPIFGKRMLSKNSQVNSSSWEFLNTDVEDECWDKKGDKDNTHEAVAVQDNPKVSELIKHKHLSKDSLYESEYDSSNTLESSSSKTSSLSAKPKSSDIFHVSRKTV